jgi:hypothetical protein
MEVKQAILLASKYVAAKPTHAVLGCIQAQNNILRAYDLNTGIFIQLPEWQPIADFCAPVDTMKKLLQKKTKDELKLSVSDRAVILEIGSSKNRFDGVDLDQFPELPVVESNDRLFIRESALLNAFNQVKLSVGKDQTKKLLTGINLNIANGKAIATATDGHKATQTSFSVDSDLTWNVTIPVKFFEILSTKSDRLIELWHDHFNICLKVDDVTVVSRLIEGKYPEIPDLSRQNFAVLDFNFRKNLLEHLAIAKAYGSDWIDLHIVRDAKTKSEGELVLALETYDCLTKEVYLPMRSPLQFECYSRVLAALSPAIKYINISYSGALYFSMKHEFISGTMDYRLPVLSSEPRSVRVDIKNFEATIKATPKNKDVMIALDTVFEGLPSMIAVSSLGENVISVLMPHKTPPKALAAIATISISPKLIAT